MPLRLQVEYPLFLVALGSHTQQGGMKHDKSVFSPVWWQWKLGGEKGKIKNLKGKKSYCEDKRKLSVRREELSHGGRKKPPLGLAPKGGGKRCWLCFAALSLLY
ncbi:putative PHD finger protein 6 [Sesbania bispinosa]|nr:putative PHD finger protein 6 [Sesbania bispinosa]